MEDGNDAGGSVMGLNGDNGQWDGKDSTSAQRRLTQRWGCAMYVAFWLVLMGVFGLLFDVWLAGQHNPNRDPVVDRHADGVVEVVLERNRRGHYVTSGEINGERVTFMVDTGASDVAVPEGVATRLGLLRGGRQVYQTANGPVVGFVTRLDRVSIGPITLHSVRGSINPGLPADGDVLLGMSFLRRIEWVQTAGELRLRNVPADDSGVAGAGR